ncbi:MAG: MarR family transcriptional regulator [Chloracidobacterium sp.]|nr:MarR family transcriptional regulator [Chloracidobacterium sp.]MDW8217828.1 MarR family transcriptional regulator [Acidobacteriota bacterium]
MQYNVLRILRGAGDDGATCHDIAARLITRDPDVTRLLDRLEHKGLVRRRRDDHDRRVVKATLTAEGLALVNQLDQPVRDWHADHFGHFSPAERRTLLALLARVTS